MKVTRAALPEILLIEPKVVRDLRGFYIESFNRRTFREATGLEPDFVQDGHSRSARNVVRGLHYQIRQPQGKLVRVVAGAIHDVVVDLRRSSPNFGKWAGFSISAENELVVWIPPGFAHGFAVLTDYADVLYKMTDFWAPDYDRTLLWNDPAIGIEWPLEGTPILAPKDHAGRPLAEADTYP